MVSLRSLAAKALSVSETQTLPRESTPSCVRDPTYHRQPSSEFQINYIETSSALLPHPDKFLFAAGSTHQLFFFLNPVPLVVSIPAHSLAQEPPLLVSEPVSSQVGSSTPSHCCSPEKALPGSLQPFLSPSESDLRLWN